MKSLSARGVMRKVAEAIPAECRGEIIVVGSLAVAYHFFGKSDGEVTTKDVDGMLSPRAHAIHNGKAIAERLFEANWKLRNDPEWNTPGNSSTPVAKLPFLRLNPPDSDEWFLELASAPAEGSGESKTLERLSTSEGDFALYSFRFLALAEEDPLATEFGLLYARPEMIALANLLHHPRIALELIGGTTDKRSNKDLGRVLALAWLSTEDDSEALAAWHPRWLAALRKRFPDEWKNLAAHAGDGLRELLGEKNKLDLEQATQINNRSLLSGRDLGPENFRATGRRLLLEVLKPLELAARDTW